MSAASSAAQEPFSSEAEETLIGRCYTKARRHPLVIGTFPGGGRLWGGPYTIPQLAVAAASFALLLLFRPLWAHFGAVGNVLIAVAVPISLAFAVRRVSVDGRNPLAVAGSVLSVLGSPAEGRLGGRPVKELTRRTAVRGRCTLTLRPSPAPAVAAVAAAAPSERALKARPLPLAAAVPATPRVRPAPAPVAAPVGVSQGPAGPVRVRSGIQARLAAHANAAHK
ncbi:hypothetical protein OG453_44755 [Streptomyces sp. NBC_01381]|uniref:hypothetical protein n=1 Tax=Streptomyces sp. NBC_01381 TaxID=2903845 RepID=UPI002252A712|nr:hypothetical protein [Streptomyces sp. NBC_01381]MCX4673670.1 hypothetical protein [Streptomyces sp. NBC_01381]